jgi:hypothetical protein
MVLAVICSAADVNVAAPTAGFCLLWRKSENHIQITKLAKILTQIDNATFSFR